MHSIDSLTLYFKGDQSSYLYLSTSHSRCVYIAVCNKILATVRLDKQTFKNDFVFGMLSFFSTK